MKTHLMLDLETFSTEHNAVITTFGVVKFDPWKSNVLASDGIYLRIDIDEQVAMGRHISESTIAWWGNQSEDVQLEATSDENRVPVSELIRQLNKINVGCDTIWCLSPTFDMIILENLYRQVGAPIPWQYWQFRDCRTLFGVHGDPREKGRVGAHNALSDCIYQAEGVQGIYTKCGIDEQRGGI